jgi:hypothetical protein
VQTEAPNKEPIDVVRIRLRADAGATAVVSEFRLANRILAAWAAQARGDSRVDYEVTFFDGLRLSGGYPLLRKGKPHASLSRVIRRLFKETAGGPAPYLVEG